MSEQRPEDVYPAGDGDEVSPETVEESPVEPEAQGYVDDLEATLSRLSKDPGEEDGGEVGENPAFRPGPLLGPVFSEKLGAVRIDPENEELQDIIRRTVKTTQAQSGSIMLPDENGEALRIVVASGLPKEVVQSSRRKIGEGMAGKAFATGAPQISRAEIPQLAEEDGPAEVRVAASVPILCYGKPLGVLSVNIQTDAGYEVESLESILRPFAVKAECALLTAIDMDGLSISMRSEILLRQVDRLLALDESTPVCLRAINDVLRVAVNARQAHFFLADGFGRKLQLMTSPRGVGIMSTRFQDLDQGWLGWVTESGSVQVLTGRNEETGEEQALVFIPLSSSRPYGLYVLECVPLEGTSAAEVQSLVTDVLSLVEETLEVAQGVEHQDFLSELRIGVADLHHRVEQLPSGVRVQSVLEMAGELLGATTAVWVPGDGSSPTTAQSSSGPAVSIMGKVWDSLDELTQWIGEVDTAAWHPESGEWQSGAPAGPAPYLGVRCQGNAVLLVFFPEEGPTPITQVPSSHLLDVLVRVGEVVAESPKVGGRVVAAGKTVPQEILNAQVLVEQVTQEWVRSLRFGHSFTLTRFRVQPDPARPGHREELVLRFLQAQRRSVDALAEVDPGTYIILSPETDRHPEGVRFRLGSLWREEHPRISLGIEIFSFPDHGEGVETYISWIHRTAPVPAQVEEPVSESDSESESESESESDDGMSWAA